ncbi:hypothetical protein RRSWK_03563 [Rhodopirellula sp. SWK7]|nr:hypothetical protein RRSWK_03563 [Rhodopirellula sp. SWK7]
MVEIETPAAAHFTATMIAVGFLRRKIATRYMLSHNGWIGLADSTSSRIVTPAKAASVAA